MAARQSVISFVTVASGSLVLSDCSCSEAAESCNSGAETRRLRVGTWNCKLSADHFLREVDFCVLTETCSRLRGLAERLAPEFEGINFAHEWKGRCIYSTGDVAFVYRRQLSHAGLSVQRGGASVVKARLDGKSLGLKQNVLNIVGAYMHDTPPEPLRLAW